MKKLKNNKKKQLKNRQNSSLHQATFFGFPLVPRPPSTYRTTQHSSQRSVSKKHSFRQPLSCKRSFSPRPRDPQENRGLALLMVLTLLVLTTTITLELQFDSRVQLQLAANSRNALQAEYLARSSLQFTNLLLALNTQFIRQKQTLKQFTKALPPMLQGALNRLEIWRIVPLNSDLLKQIAGGAFGKDTPKKEEGGDEQKAKEKLYPFGDFQGRFSATLEDESSRINLNHFNNTNSAAKLTNQLTNLFAPKRYDPLFQRTHADGNQVSRRELIGALQDWRDLNNLVTISPSSNEDSQYRYSEKGYYSKNSFIYSVDELRLIHGIDDLFFQTFGSYFTVFGRTNEINVNRAPKEVLRSMIATAIAMPPREKVQFLTNIDNDQNFRIFMQQLIRYRDSVGFNDQNNFVKYVQNPIALPTAPANGDSTPQSPEFNQSIRGYKLDISTLSNLVFEAKTFRVTAIGHVGTVQRKITAVIYVQTRGKRDVQYWRLH